MSVACLNTTATAAGGKEENYSFLVHTSRKTADHAADLASVKLPIQALESGKGKAFQAFVRVIYQQAEELYPSVDPKVLAAYVIANASRNSFVVLNSTRDRVAQGDKPAVPTTPFTVIVGGNIASRGVTFPNLLSMYFTRDVKSKLQQDTYIQRARMFGARKKYLEHFELTIPQQLLR